MRGLTEGRIVHFVTETGQHLAAIVVKVWDNDSEMVNLSGMVNLMVFNPNDGDHGDNVFLWSKTSIGYDANKGESTWHWIEPA